jgi:hypothetical protein
MQGSVATKKRYGHFFAPNCRKNPSAFDDYPFTDMFHSGEEEALLNALQHLKHNKHKVVLFHVVDTKTEWISILIIRQENSLT